MSCKERIVCASVMFGCGRVTYGRNHAECLKAGFELGFDKHNRIDGFMTTTGRHVDRVEGLQIATEMNQIVEKHRPVDVLLSEDVFPTITLNEVLVAKQESSALLSQLKELESVAKSMCKDCEGDACDRCYSCGYLQYLRKQNTTGKKETGK